MAYDIYDPRTRPRDIENRPPWAGAHHGGPLGRLASRLVITPGNVSDHTVAPELKRELKDTGKRLKIARLKSGAVDFA